MIKSIQRGVTGTVGSAGATLVITINPVDMNKSQVKLLFSGDVSGSANSCYISAYLEDSVTLKIKCNIGRSVSNIPWEVVEYK